MSKIMSKKLYLPNISISESIEEDSDPLRSPRTPTYVPNSPSYGQLSPFDPSRRFSFTLSPTLPSTLAFSLAKRRSKAPPPPPQQPLCWIWRCHLCNSRWPLGVTRRCLLDGHLYCSGESQRPATKKKKKRDTCYSEFDYSGWHEWNAWKSQVRDTLDSPTSPRGCENCEFPSQCRYAHTGVIVPVIGSPVKEKGRQTPHSPKAAEEEEEEDISTRHPEHDDVFTSHSSTEPTTTSLEELVERALVERRRSPSSGKKKQSKSIDLSIEPKTQSGSIESTSQPKRWKKPIGGGGSGKKKRGRRGSLTPVEEEDVGGWGGMMTAPDRRSETGGGSQELVMPIVESWGGVGRKAR